MFTERLKFKILLKYFLRKGRIINLNNPKLFTEKIQWLKIYDCTPIKTRLADKILVQDWVKEQIEQARTQEAYKDIEINFKKIYGIYEKYEDIDFSKLPREYVIKTNHGSKMQLLVIEGGKPDKSEKDIFNNYLKVNYAYKSGYEMQYDKIKPLIFTEEYIKNTNNYFYPLQQSSLDFQEHRQSLRSLFHPLRQNSSDFSDYRPELFEYLIFCFNGEPKLILFGSGKRSGKVCCTMFDTQWNNLHFNYGGALHDEKIPPPENLDKMLKIAKILSKDFKFVRVDLHNINGKIYFGEMTFTPASGYMKFNPRKYDRILGDMLDLTK